MTFQLSIYANHDRKLLFHGQSDDKRVSLLPPNEVVLDGKLRRVVNVHSQSGSLSLWVANLP